MASSRSNRGVFLFNSLVFMLLSCTVAGATSGEGIILFTVARKHNITHIATVTSRPVQSQLHESILRGLRKTQYEAFVELSNGLERITVLNPSDSDEGRGLEDLDVRYYIITVNMPFSNLLRLEVGSRLMTDKSDIMILITNATIDADKAGDVVLVNPDLYKDATLQVNGVNTLLHISKIVEVNPEEPENGLGRPDKGIPSIVLINARKTPIEEEGISLFQILVFFTSLYLFSRFTKLI